MKRYFLIDFENVADAGLNGFFELTTEDTVDLFYTQKNNRINIDFFKAFLDRRPDAAIRLRKVAAGNQALDLQLASFLGSLIAGADGPCEYCIISKDKGFGCLPSFWENQRNAGIVRQAGSIREALAEQRVQTQPQQQQQTKPAPAPEQPAAEEKPAEPAAQAAPAEEKAPEQASRSAPAVDAEPKPAQPEAAPQQPKQNTRQRKKPAQQRRAAAQKPQPEQPAPAADAEPKPAQPAPAAAETKQPAAEAEKPKQSPQQPNEKTVLNVKVQQALSKAKMDTQIISQTASLIAKTFGDPKIKQVVYRTLIKRHGQKQGLEVYNLVKPML